MLGTSFLSGHMVLVRSTISLHTFACAPPVDSLRAMQDHVPVQSCLFMVHTQDWSAMQSHSMPQNVAQVSAESPGMFRCIEELLSCELCPCLESLIQAAQPHLRCVCDVKEAGGDMYYRLSERRVGGFTLRTLRKSTSIQENI